VTTIRLRKNGPYVIDGEVEVVDWDGRPYAITRTPVALCRCGASKTRPFCDGTHRHCGFEASESAGGAEPAGG
jgi:CDGSH-type Zn-finger protein